MTKLKQFPQEAIIHNTKMYDEYINVYGMDNGWHPGNQKYNFNSLIRIAEMAGIPLTGKDILDVGCGTADLIDFLKPFKIQSYTGIDIYLPSLEIARKKHPDATIIEGDLLTEQFDTFFDYTFCSGTLTVKLNIDNYTYLEAMIKRMWEITKVGIAFNVLTDDDPDPDPDLFFYNPEKVLEICHEIDSEAVLGAAETSTVHQIHVYMYRDKLQKIQQ